MTPATTDHARATLDLAVDLFGVETRSFREAVWEAADRMAAQAGRSAGMLAELAMQVLVGDPGTAGEARP